MNILKPLISLSAFVLAPLSFAQWSDTQDDINFTGADLGQQTIYSSTRYLGQDDFQSLSYVVNDHQEVNDVFNRNQTYHGLHLNSTRSLDNSTIFHFSSQVSRDEQNFAGVYTKGSLSLGLSAGQGKGYIKSDQMFTGVDPYFIHAGSEAKFNYYGANAGYSTAHDSLFYIGSATVRADQLEDRQASYAGIETNNFTATVMNFKRSGESIGKGYNVSAQFNQYQVGYRQLSRENGAHSKSISIFMPAKRIKSGQLGFTVESVNNPLFREQDDINVMLSLSGEWGRTISSFHLDNEEKDHTGMPRRNKLAIIGGGIVAGAIIISSGSSDKDDGGVIKIAGQDNAAFAVLNDINPRSVREAREFGGYIYRNPNGTFGYTKPKRGQAKSISLGDVSIPNGTRKSASYHTHGDDNPLYVNEEFSPADIRSDNLEQIDGYLGTPGGKMKYHEYKTGNISTLRTIAR